MPARVRILTGARRSSREQRVDEFLIDRWRESMLIVPHAQYASARSARLFESEKVSGCWGFRPVVTFDTIARDIIRANNVPVRPLYTGERRLLIEQAIARATAAGALEEMGAAAQTDGFASHMSDIIRSLKQAFEEPESFGSRSDRSPEESFDRAIAAVYTEYQNLLHDWRAYDAEGVYWEAAIQLEHAGTWKNAAPHCRYIAFDGFDEFTEAQRKVIQLIAKELDELTFGIAIDTDSPRDSDDIPNRTCKSLEDDFKCKAVHCESPPATTSTEFAADHVFYQADPAAPKNLDRNTAFRACTSATDEVEWVAREVKRALREGTPAARIAVIARDARSYALHGQAVCAEFGIPTRTGASIPLAQTPVGGFILNVVDVLDHWQRESVIDVITTHFFPRPDSSPEVFRMIARAAGIIGGRKEWIPSLEYVQRRIEKGGFSEIPPCADASRAAQSLMDAIATLQAAERLIPAKGTRSGLARGLLRLLDAWNIHNHAESSDEIDRAIGALYRILEQVAAQPDGSAAAPRAAFGRYLRRLMNEITIDIDTARTGVVFAAMESVRHCAYDIVYIIGAAEGALPQRPRVNAILGERDYQRIAATGLDLRPPSHRIDFEMLLFARAVECAAGSLTITWPTIGPGGETILPSPFAAELQSWLVKNELADKAAAPRFTDSIAAPGMAASRNDLVRSAAANHAIDAVAWLPGTADVAQGVAIEEDRGSTNGYGPYDGILDKKAIEIVAKRYDNDHTFSVTQLESYVGCPFRFFRDRVLGVVEVREPDESFDPRIRGQILHSVLEHFHRAHAGNSVADLAGSMGMNKLRDEMRQRVFDAFDSLNLGGLPAAEGAVVLERSRLAIMLDRYLIKAAKSDGEEWKPTHFELAFGINDEEKALPPFTLNTDAGPIVFSGKIDRIDTDGDALRIIDYKTNVYWRQSDFDEGIALQLGLYTLAAERLIADGANCEDALFVSLSGKQPRVSALKYKRKDRRADREEAVIASIEEAVAGIRAGHFHPLENEHPCVGCDLRRSCRFDKARLARKEPPPIEAGP